MPVFMKYDGVDGQFSHADTFDFQPQLTTEPTAPAEGTLAITSASALGTTVGGVLDADADRFDFSQLTTEPTAEGTLRITNQNGLQNSLGETALIPGSTITFRVDGADVVSSAGIYIGMPIYGNPNIPDGGHDVDDDDGLLLPAVQDDGLYQGIGRQGASDIQCSMGF